MVATILVVVPLTLAQATSSSNTSSIAAPSSEVSSSEPETSSTSSSEPQTEPNSSSTVIEDEGNVGIRLVVKN
jgi:hypothetical protein